MGWLGGWWTPTKTAREVLIDVVQGIRWFVTEDIQAAIACLVRERDSATHKVVCCKRDADLAQTQYAQANKALDEAIERLKKADDDARVVREKFRKAVEAKATAEEMLQDERRLAEQALAKHNSDVKESNQRIASGRDAYHGVAQKLDAANAKIEEYKVGSQKLADMGAAMEQEINELRGQASALKADLTTAQQESDKLYRQNEKLELALLESNDKVVKQNAALDVTYSTLIEINEHCERAMRAQEDAKQ